MTDYPLDRHLQRSLPLSANHPEWTVADGPMPAMFLGHGAPPLLEDRRWMTELFDWTLAMPRPVGIVVVSAHWLSAPPALSSTLASAPLVYDFGGFADRYYQMTYPTPDSSALAASVAKLMPDSDPVHVHNKRGLDHGAWVPLKVMYPTADIPVVQLSLPTNDPAALLRLGERLRPLREQGILIIGSGFLTHGLPFLSREHFMGGGTPPGWSVDFDAWAGDALARGDLESLMAFRDVAPGMPYAHPTVEHFIPLFVTLGSATDSTLPSRVAIDGFGFGLSKRSIQVE